MEKLLDMGNIFINLKNVTIINFLEETVVDAYRNKNKTGNYIMEVHCINGTISHFFCSEARVESYKHFLREYQND